MKTTIITIAVLVTVTELTGCATVGNSGDGHSDAVNYTDYRNVRQASGESEASGSGTWIKPYRSKGGVPHLAQNYSDQGVLISFSGGEGFFSKNSKELLAGVQSPGGRTHTAIYRKGKYFYGEATDWSGNWFESWWSVPVITFDENGVSKDSQLGVVAIQEVFTFDRQNFTSNWEKLASGMSPLDVHKLLGIQKSIFVTKEHYMHSNFWIDQVDGHLLFYYNGGLQVWK